MKSVPITTKVVSLNPIDDEVYLIQHYVIKFVSDLWHICGFLQVLRFSSTNKTDSHDTTKTSLEYPHSFICKSHGKQEVDVL